MPRDVAAIAKKGDRKATLIALRDRLAEAIDACNDAAELSSLALRFQRTLEQIDELGGEAAQEGTDELAERRIALLSAASGS